VNDVLAERVRRKLDAMPDEQAYQVLDYIEFLESKYAPGRSLPPSALQKFAERLEDGMRLRNVAPKVISGTVGLMGTANKMIQGVQDAGRELLKGLDSATQPRNPQQTDDSSDDSEKKS